MVKNLFMIMGVICLLTMVCAFYSRIYFQYALEKKKRSVADNSFLFLPLTSPLTWFKIALPLNFNYPIEQLTVEEQQLQRRAAFSVKIFWFSLCGIFLLAFIEAVVT